jgi:hypothetical protein
MGASLQMEKYDPPHKRALGFLKSTSHVPVSQKEKADTRQILWITVLCMHACVHTCTHTHLYNEIITLIMVSSSNHIILSILDKMCAIY